jgi:hypothetical protein
MAKGIKTGGREAGTPNKLTKELRAALKDLLHQELQNLPEHLNSLEPKDRLEILVKLLPYALPKVEAVNYTENEPMDWGID